MNFVWSIVLIAQRPGYYEHWSGIIFGEFLNVVLEENGENKVFERK